jgi:hypothetical protein
MLVSIFILGFSAACAVYWAHHCCVLLVGRRQLTEQAQAFAEANRLDFLRVRAMLQTASSPHYDGLLDALRRDFDALTYMLRYAATLHVDRFSGTERLLMADFAVMRMLCRMGARFSPLVARQTLLQMIAIVEHLSGLMGQRTKEFSAQMLAL